MNKEKSRKVKLVSGEHDSCIRLNPESCEFLRDFEIGYACVHIKFPVDLMDEFIHIDGKDRVMEVDKKEYGTKIYEDYIWFTIEGYFKNKPARFNILRDGSSIMSTEHIKLDWIEAIDTLVYAFCREGFDYIKLTDINTEGVDYTEDEDKMLTLAEFFDLVELKDKATMVIDVTENYVVGPPVVDYNNSEQQIYTMPE